jgi:uncharacterized protein (TIGR02001 family)
LGALSVSGQTATTPAPAPETAVPVATAPTSSITLTPAVVSQYMFRGVRLGGPSFEPNVEFDSGNLGIGVWANFPISDKVVGQSDPEIDPYAYYTITINDSLSVVPGFTWYNYPHADDSIGFYKATFEPSLTVNYTVGGVKLSPKIYYDVVLNGPTFEFTAAFAVPLKDMGTELDFIATVGAYTWKTAADNTTPDVKNYGDYWLVGVSAPFAITSSSKIVVGFAYTQGTNNYFKQSGSPKVKNTAAVGRGVITVSYAITF